MKKIHLVFLTLLKTSLFILFLFLAPKVFAADLDVTCDSDDCIVSPSGPLFSETNIYPNWNITKTIKAINNYSQDAAFAVEVADLTDLSDLGDVLRVTIKKSGDTTNIYDDNLTNFKNYGYLSLSDISAGGTQDYDFSVGMQLSADSQYQNLDLNFDLTLGFELLPIPSGPTSTPGSAGCTAVAPSPPSSLTTSAVSSSVINLTWSAPPETLTHYSVSYGLNPGSYIYGAVNVGNVTDYTVSGLSSGTTYYFVVYAVNDCISSGPSNEASATTAGVLGVFVASGPAAGFEVLGVQTEIATTPIGQPEESGQIEGTQIDCSRYWLPILYLLAFFINLLHYYNQIEKSRQEESRVKHLFPVFLSVLTYFVDKFFLRDSCCLVNPTYCDYFWIGNILSWFIPLYYYHKQSQ